MSRRVLRPAVLQRFGRLRVVIPEGRMTNAKGDKTFRYAALCICDCGQLCSVRLSCLWNGRNTSCGCMRGTMKHGLSRNIGRHYIAKAWNGIQQRCCNPNDKDWDNYGGRGIELRFDGPEHLLAELGERPSPRHSIDRIDNDGHYEPGNVRWATNKEQTNNTRRNRLIEFQGRTLTAAQWDEEMGYTRTLVAARLNLGWSVEKAITTPMKLAGLIEYQGESKTLTAWAAHLGVKPATLRRRLDRGWSIECALSVPVNN